MFMDQPTRGFSNQYAAQMCPPSRSTSDSEVAMPSIRQYAMRLLGNVTDAVSACGQIHNSLIIEPSGPECGMTPEAKDPHPPSLESVLRLACDRIIQVNEKLNRIRQVLGE
jgi:hypothetical protein